MVRIRAVVTLLSIWLLATSVAGCGAFASAGAPSEPPVTNNALRLATDDVLPSIVEVLEDVHGSVVDDRDGTTHGPYDASFSGSGFFVSADGYIVTAAHVASPTAAELSDDLVGNYIDDLYNCDPTSSSDQCAGVEALHHDDVLPHVRASGTSSVLHVLLQSMQPSDDGLPATLVTASQSTSLDVAVLHLDGLLQQPVAILAPALANPDTPLSVLGYPVLPAGQPDTVVPTVTVGRVTNVLPPDRTSDIAPDAHLIEISARTLEGNSGGPGVDRDGRVEGIVSYGLTDTDNFLVSAEDVAGVVAQTPARNVLGPTDRAWRDGLSAEAAHDPQRALDMFRQCTALAASAVQCADHARAAAAAVQPRPGSPRDQGGGAVPVVAAAVGAAVLVSAVAGAVLVTRRRTRRPVPATGASTPPPPPPPPPPWAP